MLEKRGGFADERSGSVQRIRIYLKQSVVWCLSRLAIAYIRYLLVLDQTITRHPGCSVVMGAVHQTVKRMPASVMLYTSSNLIGRYIICITLSNLNLRDPLWLNISHIKQQLVPCYFFCSRFSFARISMATIKDPIDKLTYIANGAQPVFDKEISSVSPSSSNLDAETADVSAEFERKLLRKIDFWLVGFYSLIYVFRVIDSANYSNAAIINLEAGTGIKKQLGFTPSQWAWTLSIFSYSYLIFEPTNTILLKLFKPSRWMFILIMAWGVSACCSAAAMNFSGMMCVRFAIGVAEAGFFPSVLYHYAFWYKPVEMPQRIAFFYSVGQLSSALSGLLAYAISHMDQLGGLSGWRWLFLLEGLPAIILAFFAFWLPDYPETARFLTEEERSFMKSRLASNAPKGQKHWDFASLKVMAKDPSLYTFSLYWISHGIGGFGVSFALPTVIYQLGFTTTAYSQLMNIVSNDRKLESLDTNIIATLRFGIPTVERLRLHAAEKMD